MRERMRDWKVNKHGPYHKVLYMVCILVVVWILTELLGISKLKGNFVS